MAYSSREKYGYEDELFEKDVDDEFHCPICHNVLKRPRMCENNEHIFCHDCITKHLRVNSATCPQCQDRLTVETLRRAPRVLINCISKLKMKCDYFDRGCQEFIPLEELPSHVKNCGFAPVKCSNEECQMVINKQEQIHHETVCTYREVKCHSCPQIQVNMVQFKESVQKQLNEVQSGIEVAARKVDAATASVEMTKEVLGLKVEQVEKHIEETVETLQQDVKAIKQSQLEMSLKVDLMSGVLNEVLGKLRSLELSNQEVSSVGEATDAVLKDILVAGGFCVADGGAVEKFCRKKNIWVPVKSTNAYRLKASSFVYQCQIFVVCGAHPKAKDTMEIMNARDEVLNWRKFPGSLPYPCFGHQTVVCGHCMILIGGWNFSISSATGSISELHLTPPYSHKLLAEMPEPRMSHCAEIFGNKLLILGGSMSGCDVDALDSVLEFDLNTNEFKVMPSLPVAVSNMATVCWKDKVVVMGGCDKNGKVLNYVFMYDCKTGKIDVLPSMLEKRCGCCAVITGNTIVVIGGWCGIKPLSSVENFTFGDKAWKYLPAMKEARNWAIAEVVP